MSTLLYRSVCWWMTERDLAKQFSFHTTSLRKMLCIFWPRTISNRDLLAQCQQEDMETTITRKQWRWIEHMLHMDANSITKIAIHWTPEGKRKRGDNSVKNCGDNSVKSCGDNSVKSCGDNSVKNCGDNSVKNCGDNSVKNCGSRNEEHEPKLGHPPEAG